MIRLLDTIREVLGEFDCAVLDQWGVLHNGTSLYPGVIPCLEEMKRAGKSIIVLSNSGRRAGPNLARIEAMGIRSGLIDQAITSGEILWNEIRESAFAGFGSRAFRACATTRTPADLTEWLDGLTAVTLVESAVDADLILLLGTPDGIGADHYDRLLRTALKNRIPLVCANPDKSSPRSSGTVVSPGFFADRFATMGGQVVNYGKPFPAVFDAVRKTNPNVSAERFLMIGDSLEHDIAGGAKAGMKTLFVRGGLFADQFDDCSDPVSIQNRLAEIVREQSLVVVPDFSLRFLN